MADASRFRGLGSSQRPRTPLSPLALFPDEYDGSHDHSNHRYHSLPGFSPQRQTRRAVHKVSSLLSLNIGIGSGRESRLTASPSPTTPGYASSVEDSTSHEVQAPSPRRQVNTWHNPTLMQMIESLQAAMMMKRDALAPIPIKYNSYVLAMIEGFAHLEQQLQAKDTELADLKQLREKELEGFRGMSEEWIQRENDYKAEIKRLELLLAKESRDGVASVALARSGTLVDRTVSKKFQARLQRMSNSYDAEDHADDKPPLRKLTGTVHFPRGNTHHKTIGNISRVLDVDSDVAMSRAVQEEYVPLTRRSHQEHVAQQGARVRTLGALASLETRQHVTNQATYIPTGAESPSGGSRHVRMSGKPSQYDIDMAQQLLDSTSSSGSTISTEDGNFDIRRDEHGLDTSSHVHVKQARKPLVGNAFHRSGQEDITETLTGISKTGATATFVGLPCAKIAKAGRQRHQTSEHGQGKQIGTKSTGSSPTDTTIKTFIDEDADTLPQDGSGDHPVWYEFPSDWKPRQDKIASACEDDSLVSTVQRQPRHRRPRGFSFLAGDDVLPLTPLASSATHGIPMEADMAQRTPLSDLQPASPATNIKKNIPPAGPAHGLDHSPNQLVYLPGNTTAEVQSNMAPSCVMTPLTPGRVSDTMHSSNSAPRMGRVPASGSTGSVIYVGRDHSTASSSSNDRSAGKRVPVTVSSHGQFPSRKESNGSHRSSSPSTANQRVFKASSGNARGRGGISASTSNSSLNEQELITAVRESNMPPGDHVGSACTLNRPGLPKRNSAHSSTVNSSGQSSKINAPTASAKHSPRIPVATTNTAQLAAARAIAKLHKGPETHHPS